MDGAIVIFEFIVLIFSAVLHEVAHGYEAERLGDPTARNAGRLTLNPFKHLELFGSFLMPLLIYIASGGAFFFAVAKPVPYEPNNLKDPRMGAAKIAFAGPAVNFALAIIFGLGIRLLVAWPSAPVLLLLLFAIIVFINLLLGIFNLIPIPPLDGSKVLFAFLPQTETTYRVMYFLERWGMAFVLLFVFFGFSAILPVMHFLFTLITGQSLGI